MQARESITYRLVDDIRLPFFVVARVKFPDGKEPEGSVAQSIRSNIRSCWDEARNDLVELSKKGAYGRPVREMFQLFNLSENLTLSLKDVGSLVGEKNADRLRQIRAALQIGTLAIKTKNKTLWRFTQEELAIYTVGIMADRLYGLRDRRKKASEAEPKT